MQEKRKRIIEDKIPGLLIRLTLPSIIGMLGLMVFNVVDTFYVGRLGAIELAAISFTFPVVMVINSFTLGIGIATMSIFAKAVGNQDRDEERRLATSALLLGLLIAVTVSIIGYLTMEPLFTMLGAGSDLLPYILDYMSIWYIGTIFIVVPMIGDNILRGLGDTKTPSFVMLTVACINLILDPLLIFGLGPFPEMGIRGAAIATVFSRMIASVVSILIQTRREHLISFKTLTISQVLKEWKGLLFLGIPNAAVKAIIPFGAAIFTSILAKYGYEAVAGYGVAAKLEGVVFAIINSLGVTTAVFTGLNLGAKRIDRVKTGIKWCNIYGIIIGMVSAALLYGFGAPLASLFNSDPDIQRTTALYLSIVPISYALYSIGQNGTSILNVYHKPMLVSLQNLFQIGVIAIPLAYLLSNIWGVTGLFIAIGISYIGFGLISLFIVSKTSKKVLV